MHDVIPVKTERPLPIPSHEKSSLPLSLHPLKKCLIPFVILDHEARPWSALYIHLSEEQTHEIGLSQIRRLVVLLPLVVLLRLCMERIGMWRRKREKHHFIVCWEKKRHWEDIDMFFFRKKTTFFWIEEHGQGLLSSDQKMTSSDVAAAVSIPRPGKERLQSSRKEV